MKKAANHKIEKDFAQTNGTVPLSLFWDYKKYSNAKRIQRVAMFFPQIGRDKKSVIELYKNIDALDIPSGNKKLIELYYELIKKGKLP